jgi:hypothetical protein
MSKLTLVKFPPFTVGVTGRHQPSVARATPAGSDDDSVEVHRKLLARSADALGRIPTTVTQRIGEFASRTCP